MGLPECECPYLLTRLVFPTLDSPKSSTLTVVGVEVIVIINVLDLIKTHTATTTSLHLALIICVSPYRPPFNDGLSFCS